MKNVLFILLLAILNTAMAQKKETYNALLDLNKEWQFYKKLVPEEKMVFETEQEKIQFHLNKAISFLQNNSSNFDAKQMENRQYLLNELQQYADLSIFPTNTFHTKRTPYFVDVFGVHCAVGYMMHRSGNDALVAKIKADHNYDYIANIKTEGVKEWAEKHGFSMEELKWIQPTYGATQTYETLLEGTNGPVLKFQKNNYPEEILSILGSFDTLNNLPCHNIGFYDGENLNCYGSGIQGKVNDISLSEKLYAVGALAFENNIYSFAQWENNEWQYLNIPTREAAEITAINTQSAWYSGIYVSLINPNNTEISEIWNLKNDIWSKTASITGQIYDIKNTNGASIFAGHFDTAFITNTFTPNQDDTILTNNVLIFQDDNTWNAVGSQISDTVFTIVEIGSSIYFGGSCAYDEICLTRYLNYDLQPLVFNHQYDSMPNRINELYYKSNTLHVTGKFSAHTMMYTGQHYAVFDIVNNIMVPRSTLNNEVQTIGFFGNELILGGNFSDTPYAKAQYLAKYAGNANQADPIEDPVNSLKENYASKIFISPNPFQNEINISGVNQKLQYEIYNSSGKLISSGKIFQNKIKNLEDLDSGFYILKLFNDVIFSTKKVLKN